MLKAGDITVFNQQGSKDIREIHMVTAEFSTKLKNGKEMEAYRWDPGTVFLEKGEKVRLFISGINGEEHPFYIEGTKIKGTVKKEKRQLFPYNLKKKVRIG